MADITERPADHGTEGVTPAPQSGLPPGGLSGMPEDPVYRPMSLLAIVGFCLSMLFAGFLLIGTLVALFNRTALLPSLEVFVIPALIIIGVCWVARLLIRQSENTLSGEKLAGWGIGLTVTLCVLFGAYYAATYFAVTQQASEFTDRWVAALKEGDPGRAYWYLIPPSDRADIPLPTNAAQDARLHDRLEMDFSNLTKNIPYGEFRRSELLTLFRRAGPEAKVHRIGVSEWKLEKGTYQVVVRYRVEMSEATADLLVKVIGQEASMGEFEGRGWYVHGKESNFVQPIQFTELGEKHLRNTKEAHAFSEKFRHGIGTVDTDLLYLATIPEQQREAATVQLLRAKPGSFPALSGIGILGAVEDANRKHMIGRRLFEAGGIIDFNAQEFWAPTKKVHDDIIARASKLFSSIPRRAGGLTLNSIRIPMYEEKAGHAFVTFDATMILLNDETPPAPLYEVESQLSLEGSPDLKQPGRLTWHISKLKLLSGHRTSAQQRPPGRGGP
jgi:hypothetical protein